MATTYGHGGIYQRKSDGLWVATAEHEDNRDRGDSPRKKHTFASKTREGALAKLEAYREANPPAGEAVAAPQPRLSNMARARALGTHTAAEWRALVKSTGGRCEYCGVQTSIVFKGGVFKSPRKQVKDHRTPVAAGGSDAISNLAVVCYQCNALKGLMDEVAFRAWMAARP